MKDSKNKNKNKNLSLGSREFWDKLILGYEILKGKLLLGFILSEVDISTRNISFLLKDHAKLLTAFIEKSDKNYAHLYKYEIDIVGHNPKRWISIQNSTRVMTLVEAKQWYHLGKYRHILHLYEFLLYSQLKDEITLQLFFPKRLTLKARLYLQSKFSSNIQIL